MAYQKYFTLSYDDGVHADKQMIEIINAYGLKCTFNLNSGLMPEEDTSSWYVCRQHVRDIYKGHEIATHGHTHPWFNKLTEEETEADICKDIEMLSALAGYPTLGHAYPFGVWIDSTVDILRRSGIIYARTINSTHSFDLPSNPLILDPTCHHADTKVFSLIDKFIEAEPQDSDMLFYMWGHSFEFNKNTDNNNWRHLEEICKRISGKNDIIYCTNMEFIDSIKTKI